MFKKYRKVDKKIQKLKLLSEDIIQMGIPRITRFYSKTIGQTILQRVNFLYINRVNFRPMIIWHYIIKKSLITDKNIYFVDVKNGEDEEFGMRLLCSAKSISLLKKITIGIKKERKALFVILEV